MAETNKSKMMSEAEIIEAINSDSLVSVSLGAGQPQKNVKLSTLASVVAGNILNKGTFSVGGKQRVDITNHYNTSSGMRVALITLIQGNYSCLYLVYSNSATFHRVIPLENATDVIRVEIFEGKLTIYNNANTNYTIPLSILYLN